MRKLVIIVLMLTAVVAGSAVPAGAQAATTSQMEQEFVSLINELRASQGLPPFATHPELVDKARRWSATMSAEGRIWHSNLPEGIQAPWRRLGENVGMGGSVRSLHDAFVGSPGHYRNLIDPDFRLVGIGVVLDADGTIFVSQAFMQLQDTHEGATPAAPADQAAPNGPEADPHSPVPAASVAGAPVPGAEADSAPARPTPEPLEQAARGTDTELSRSAGGPPLGAAVAHPAAPVAPALVAILMLALAVVSLRVVAESRLARATRRYA